MRLLASLFVVCFTTLTAAPPQTHTLTGTVVDSSGAPIPGATIELLKGAKVEGQTVSNEKGVWRFFNVARGEYVVRHAMQGFRTADVRVTVGDSAPRPLRVVMEIGGLNETVSVHAAAPAIQRQHAMNAVIADGLVSQHVSSVYRTADTASYAHIEDNRFRRVAEHPLSTFSIDVDTASYANVRRFLNMGTLPPADAVRIEELINYFRFDYPEPRAGAPVSVTTELGAAPWEPTRRLVLVGLRSAPLKLEKTPPRNLTFLLDVSGSMSPASRLPLVKTAMQMLVDTLRPEDKVAIVVYAGQSGLALPATSGARRDVIKHAIEELRAGGSTNGASGIQLAYDIASENFVRGGINRVILATDGDFNVGITSHAELTKLIEGQRDRGIFLSVLGVGDDNLQDSAMEMLADKGTAITPISIRSRKGSAS